MDYDAVYRSEFPHIVADSDRIREGLPPRSEHWIRAAAEFRRRAALVRWQALDPDQRADLLVSVLRDTVDR